MFDLPITILFFSLVLRKSRMIATTRLGNESSRTCLSSTQHDKNWFGSKLDSSSARLKFASSSIRLVKFSTFSNRYSTLFSARVRLICLSLLKLLYIIN
ncbi:hypothetical protein QL285_020069 [Trifolium repens]|nr:hypothetical protein QL285_020069 [Trifolium repens]